MAVVTNFDPLDVGGSGLKILAGEERHDVVLAITAALVATGHFTEVTGSGPTHATLQPYGSTGVSAAGTSVTSPGTPRHVTLRFTTDDEAVNGYGRLVRFFPCDVGVQICLLDTYTASNPGTDALEWLLCFTQGSVVNLTTQGKTDLWDAVEDLGLNHTLYDDADNGPIINAPASGSVPNTGTTWATNMTIYFWCDSNWLMLLSVRDSDQQNFGDFFCFVPAVPADSHWTRTNRPTLCAMHLNNSFDDTGDDDTLWKGHIGMPGTATLEPDVEANSFFGEIGTFWSLKAPNNEEYLARVVANIQSGGEHAFMGLVPGLYIMRNASGVSRFDELTISGQNYHVVHNHGQDYAFLVHGGADS